VRRDIDKVVNERAKGRRTWVSKTPRVICASTDARTLLGSEIRERAKDMISAECWFEGATLMTYDWRGCPKAVCGLYVHPKTGLLQRTKSSVR